jgi:hypothetical protein
VGKNPHGYWFSEFYHKDRGGKLQIGPIWDFDMCFGNTWYNDGHLRQDWRWRRATIEHYLWYKRLFKDADFLQRYIDRWTELRVNVLSTSNVLALVGWGEGNITRPATRTQNFKSLWLGLHAGRLGSAFAQRERLSQGRRIQSGHPAPSGHEGDGSRAQRFWLMECARHVEILAKEI